MRSSGSLPDFASRSIGFRGFSSRLIAPDRASRILGHRYEESYLRQAVGHAILASVEKPPARAVVLASDAEMDVITRSGLASTLATAFRGNLELRELGQPALRDVLLASQLDDSNPLLVVLLGSEKKPAAWPLPDFSKVAPAPHAIPGSSLKTRSKKYFGVSGDWLRLGRKGGMSFLDPRILETAWNHGGTVGQQAQFEYSWGIWSATISQAARRLVRIETVNTGSVGAGLLALSGEARETVIRFIRGFNPDAGGLFVASVPTPESGRWLMHQAGIAVEGSHGFILSEDLHGWGPAFSLLRFVSDFPSGSRMVVMRDLASFDLLEIR